MKELLLDVLFQRGAPMNNAALPGSLPMIYIAGRLGATVR